MYKTNLLSFARIKIDLIKKVDQVNFFNSQQWQQSSFTCWNNCPLRYERESVQQPCTHSTIEPSTVSFKPKEETKVLRRMAQMHLIEDMTTTQLNQSHVQLLNTMFANSKKLECFKDIAKHESYSNCRAAYLLLLMLI